MQPGTAARVPLTTLYSATDAKMTKLFFATLDSLRMGIMQGRNSPGEWDGAIKNWRQKADDKMRAEYEQAWEARSS
ncbi:hypothetical protein ACGFMO_34775 [Streptomyces niveus]|uniref:hypothetical protein n=1 Tax=Streptomyces niveus TaxID=193462 RepID=UPI00371D1615